jgi:hypothetical protein
MMATTVQPVNAPHGVLTCRSPLAAIKHPRASIPRKEPIVIPDTKILASGDLLADSHTHHAPRFSFLLSSLSEIFAFCQDFIGPTLLMMHGASSRTSANFRTDHPNASRVKRGGTPRTVIPARNPAQIEDLYPPQDRPRWLSPQQDQRQEGEAAKMRIPSTRSSRSTAPCRTRSPVPEKLPSDALRLPRFWIKFQEI